MFSFTLTTTLILALLFNLSTIVSANTILFVNQDSTTRHIVFTAQQGLASIGDLTITGSDSITQDIPESWIGNFYSYNDGTENVVGMLGEVRFQGYESLTYFDVNAISNQADQVGVREISPASAMTPVAGCNDCDYTDTDPETLATAETDLVCLLGT